MPSVPAIASDGAFDRSVRDQINSNFQALGLDHTPGSVWYVHGNLGNDNNDGKAWGSDRALRTMAEAFSRVGSGDIIYFAGNIAEQLDTPAGIFDVKVIGAGNRPRHADAHSGSSGYSGSTWKPPASPAATTPLCRVRQQGWKFFNILFDAPSDDACLEFMRDAAAGDSERDSSHGEVAFCRFTGGQDGILISGTEIVHNLHIHDNVFNDLTTAIKTSIAADYARRLLVCDNVFMKNTNHIVAGMYESVIRGNVLGNFTTLSIDLTGSGGGLNVITDNFLSGTFSIGGGYKKSAASDDWGGNWNTGVGVLTTSDPA